jgi:hypothetical protein
MYKLQRKKDCFCDICGAPSAAIRTITLDGEIINELSGFSCDSCMGQEEEQEYVEELDEKLEKDEDLRKQLYDRFNTIRFNEKSIFISRYGVGESNEKCELCSKRNAYLCIVEKQHTDGSRDILDELTGWYCIDCITTGIEESHTENELKKLVFFHAVCENPILGLGRFPQLEKQAKEYSMRTSRMRKARDKYTGIPIKTLLMIATQGQKCSCCGEICDEKRNDKT